MPYIERILKFDWIKLIVPDVIDNSSHGRNRMRLSRATDNGFNLTFGGAAAQKFRVVCDPTDENREAIEAAIAEVDKSVKK